MDSIEPSLFYTGIVAQLYSPLRGSGPVDPTPYAKFIERCGEPALELGCGDGDPMLALRELGLDIEGLDSSPDMIERCRAAATARGIDIVTHVQPMESMRIDRQFRSIFLAGPTFNLLPTNDVGLAALNRIREHLAPQGSALIPLFIPTATPPNALGFRRAHTADDGSEISVTYLSEDRDESTRCQTTLLRYELTTSAGTQSEDRQWLLHWYTQDGFRELAESAGLTIAKTLSVTGVPVTESDQAWSIILRHPNA
jgi:Methyltransferase domain